jgi:small subunit ribosomal protein S20
MTPAPPEDEAPSMANHKQAEKRNRQRIKRRARNLMHLSSMRTYMKRVRRALAAGDLEAAKTALPVAVKAIGHAASKGVIHGNTASRYVSRLTLAVNAASAKAA